METAESAMGPAGGPARPRAPLFLVLDGVDGCGKTTQAGLLARALGEGRGEHDGPLHLREPGSTAAGEAIRALILGSEVSLDAGTLALLFTAARRETLHQLVAPALAAGRDVVVERFHASTFSYQGPASEGGVPAEDLLGLLHGWAGTPAPDLEVVLDLDPGAAHGRARERAGDAAADRFEARGVAFQRAVRDGLLDYVQRTERAVLVDAAGAPAEVHGRILDEVRRRRATEAVHGD